MIRRKLCALIALTLGAAATAQAQDYDDRWYFAPYVGYYNSDEDRLTEEGSMLFGAGIGRHISSNAAFEVFVDRTYRTYDGNAGLRGLPSGAQTDVESGISNLVIGGAVRFFFGGNDRFSPFVMAGAGLSNHRGGVENGWDPAFQAGVGFASAYNDNIKFRTELAYRHDMDDESIPGEDSFGDWMLNVGLMIALGDAPEAAREEVREEVQETRTETDCSALDDDKDGINNCDDKCPNSAAGSLVGPDGCPQDVVIDLRGVEFKFDRPSRGESNIEPTLKEPASEGIAILDQAVDVLNRYPNIRVEVAGHTDAIGTDAYNQDLSERRAQIVYDYLTSHGVDAGRLAGPVGYGESRPIDTNETKEGRQRNRRTELSVQK
jgi:OmpA-OmpF porin, OOP family